MNANTKLTWKLCLSWTGVKIESGTFHNLNSGHQSQCPAFNMYFKNSPFLIFWERHTVFIMWTESQCPLCTFRQEVFPIYSHLSWVKAQVRQLPLCTFIVILSLQGVLLTVFILQGWKQKSFDNHFWKLKFDLCDTIQMEIAFGYNSTEIHFIHSEESSRRWEGSKKFKISPTRNLFIFFPLSCASFINAQ